MCRALRVLCAAASQDRLAMLRQASTGVAWEIVGGAEGLEDLARQLESWHPDVVVLDAELGPEAVRSVQRIGPWARMVSLGEVPGVDEVAGSTEDIRSAILGLPRPGGPVRA